MSKTQRFQIPPATERFYVFIQGAASLVVRGWHLAEPYGQSVGVNPVRVESLVQAHETLRASLGYVPDSAMEIADLSKDPARSGTPKDPGEGAAEPEEGRVDRQLPRVRVETELGVIDKTVTDPGEIEALKAARLWP